MPPVENAYIEALADLAIHLDKVDSRKRHFMSLYEYVKEEWEYFISEGDKHSANGSERTAIQWAKDWSKFKAYPFRVKHNGEISSVVYAAESRADGVSILLREFDSDVLEFFTMQRPRRIS